MERNHMKTKFAAAALWAVSSSFGLAVVGCAHHDHMDDEPQAEMKPRHVEPKEEDFPAEDQVRAVDRFASRQSAAGARSDANLFAAHFDCNQLNALGQTKINLMFQSQNAQDCMVIYVDVPRDQIDACRTSVEQYARQMAMSSGKFQVKAGANPDSLTPARVGLAGLPRTDSQYKSALSGNMDTGGMATSSGTAAPAASK